jgi:hypothetical protein
MTRKHPDYAGMLLRSSPPHREPPHRKPPPEPKKTHARKALFAGKITDMKPHQRHMGSLLKDIAKISTQYPTLTSRFTKHLLKLPQYKHADRRTLSRDVAEALARQDNFLMSLCRDVEEALAPFQKHLLRDVLRDVWLNVGIEPPRNFSKRALRQKSLEQLRNALKGRQK